MKIIPVIYEYFIHYTSYDRKKTIIFLFTRTRVYILRTYVLLLTFQLSSLPQKKVETESCDICPYTSIYIQYISYYIAILEGYISFYFAIDFFAESRTRACACIYIIRRVQNLRTRSFRLEIESTSGTV